MKNETLTSRKSVSVQEILPDKLFQEMSVWSDRIAKRAYDFFAASGFTDGHDVEDWFKAEKELLNPIALDVEDSEDRYVVKAQVPGFDAKDLEIHMSGSHLVIQGKHETTQEQKAKGAETVECKSEQIYRAIELPEPVLAERAQAELKSGVLELKLPKAEKTKQVKVAAA